MAGQNTEERRGVLVRFLDMVEWIGNKLPDPVVLFLIGIVIVWGLSALLSMVSFTELDPRALPKEVPIKIKNMFSLTEFAGLLANMVNQFVNFPPLGVVLVALLGVGVAEYSGFINAVLKSMLDFTPKMLLTPMVILVAIISHTAADAGYVLVIPLAGLMFHAAGRHPLAGIAAAFAGVSGGFSANFVPSGIDPLLAGLTEVGANIADTNYSVNPLCNWYFTAVSSFLIIIVGWVITDSLIEPKLKSTPVDGDPKDIPVMETLSPLDRKAMVCGLIAMSIGVLLLIVWAWPTTSALRDKFGSLTSNRNAVSDLGFDLVKEQDQFRVTALVPTGAGAAAGLAEGDILLAIKGISVADYLSGREAPRVLKPDVPLLIESSREGVITSSILTPKSVPGAPLMSSIVPLIFIFFVIPGIVHGYISGKFQNHRDVIKGMSKSMESMAYYLVLVFFVAIFIYVFNASNIGVLLAVKGAGLLKGQPPIVIIIGIILLTALVNLLVGSASAKWAMLAPIFVPMLMILGISPELAQASYRVGDSTTNIITPLMPYFPLVVIYCQRYFSKTGIGTLTSLMLPYSVCLLVLWSVFLIIYWQIGFPLGIDGGYEYVKAE
ncbi:MAG TPA: AbgT family transporter [Pirellulaceae bacterium]|nr:AbgT family transporter [Pirellulaceae bacterium]HMO92047.1 AbgT family transporter [Pirellulaceae bacterium]HMP68846.1 AbgT family transporter [Pirellulaceae bacterium]